MRRFSIVLIIISILLCACYTEAPSQNHTKDDRVVIALVDTGVSTTAIQSDHLLPGWNYVTGSSDTEDRINHGTAVASVILGCESAGVAGAAPDAYLVPLVVQDKAEGVKAVSAAVLAEVIRDSVDRYQADIINISLGIQKDVPELKDAVAYAESRGVVVVCAAGNEGGRELYYPAAYESTIAVGSHDKEGKVSDFSQKNGTVDLLAPGEDIWLASRNGKTYGARGTSYATGFVSAAAANLLQADSSLSPEEIRQTLYTGASDLETPGYDDASGWGILTADSRENIRNQS